MTYDMAGWLISGQTAIGPSRAVGRKPPLTLGSVDHPGQHLTAILKPKPANQFCEFVPFLHAAARSAQLRCSSALLHDDSHRLVSSVSVANVGPASPTRSTNAIAKTVEVRVIC